MVPKEKPDKLIRLPTYQRRMSSFSIQTKGKQSVTDITPEVKRLVAASGTAEGMCLVYVQHTTAAIAIKENEDPEILVDFLDALERLVPAGAWRHDRLDGNGDAHIKAATVGPSATIPIIQGSLTLGRFQNIFLCDFDGPRQRSVIVKIIAEK